MSYYHHNYHHDDTENVRKLNIRVREEKKKKVLGNTQLSSAQQTKQPKLSCMCVAGSYDTRPGYDERLLYIVSRATLG